MNFIKNPFFKFILPILIILYISGCATLGFVNYNAIPGEVTPSEDYTPVWSGIYSGVERCSYSQESPPFAIEVIRINLHNPERKIVITPGVKELNRGKNDKNFLSMTTSSFLEKYECLIAINATPYKPFRYFEGQKQTAVGVVISDGIMYSDNSEYDVFTVGPGNSVSLIEEPFMENKKDPVENAAGGFFIILEDGINTGYKGNRHPRSLAGISKDGDYLILAVIDGEDMDRSIGASLYESAEWMDSLGAFNAMILDGGGSSTLVVRGEDGKSLLLNHPSGSTIFSAERPVAVHIGVK